MTMAALRCSRRQPVVDLGRLPDRRSSPKPYPPDDHLIMPSFLELVIGDVLVAPS
jgi:hypothetical protein